MRVLVRILDEGGREGRREGGRGREGGRDSEREGGRDREEGSET